MSLKKFMSYAKWSAVIAAWNLIGLGAFGGASTPFYRVKQEHARVLTHIDGSRTIDDKVGVHFRFNSINPTKWVFTTKEYSQRVEYLHLDNDPKPHTMQAADKLTFQGAGVWTYRVVDLEKYGIKMGNKAQEMLTEQLNGIAKAKIQSKNIEAIVTKIDTINQEIMNSKEIKELENKYGIDIQSFNLKHATYPKEMNEKAAEAKGIKIKAEAIKNAAEDLAKAKETLAAANKKYLQELIDGSGVQTEEGRKKALEILDHLNMYEMLEKRPAGENTYIFTPSGSAPNMTLPSKDKQEIIIVPPEKKPTIEDDGIA